MTGGRRPPILEIDGKFTTLDDPAMIRPEHAASMIKSLELQNVGPAPRLFMEFGSRLNLITGDNGLGKSFLLDVVFWCFTRKWPRELNRGLSGGFPARPSDPKSPAFIEFEVESRTKTGKYRSDFVARDQAWTGKAGRPLNPGLVIYAHSDGGFSVWDPARNYWSTKGKIDVQERVPAYVFTEQELWDGLEHEGPAGKVVLCNGLLRDWSSWIESRTPLTTSETPLVDQLHGLLAGLMEMLISTLSSPDDRIRVAGTTRISIDDARRVPSLKLPYADNVPILYCSSAIRRITALAYILLWSTMEHKDAAGFLGESPTSRVTLLLDEIECHLHPRWQRSILPALLMVMEGLHKDSDIQIIGVTHSPLVLASVEALFDRNKDAWFDLDLERLGRRPEAERREVVLNRREMMRLGKVERWLESEAFDLPIAGSLDYQKAVQAARELFLKDIATDEEVERVDTLLRAALGETDRFWVSWEQFLEDRNAAAPR